MSLCESSLGNSATLAMAAPRTITKRRMFTCSRYTTMPPAKQKRKEEEEKKKKKRNKERKKERRRRRRENEDNVDE